MQALNNVFSIPELRTKLIYTLLILAIFRLGAQIPAPGVDPVQLQDIMANMAERAGGGIFTFINLFTGGALQQLSIFALGIMPYISSSIIMQLLQSVFPALDRLAKEEGPAGRRKIQLYIKLGTILIAVIQAIGLLLWIKHTGIAKAIYGYSEKGSLPGYFPLVFIFTLTAGEMFLVWLGEMITNYGISNGASVLIFAGILARVPSATYQLFEAKGGSDLISVLVAILVFVIVMGLVVLNNQATRRVPVQYPKRFVGARMYAPTTSYIPFKMNPAGVIAIIFAASLILFPAQLLSWFGRTSPLLQKLANWFAPGNLAYFILYFLLVIFFSYFYTAIYFNPTEIAENLKKQGGFIPGIRPGQQTAEFLSKLLNRITLPGAIFTGIIAIFPDIVQLFLNIPRSFARLMGGTSILIIVGVALDMVQQIESHLLMRNKPGFLRKGKIIGRR